MTQTATIKVSNGLIILSVGQQAYGVPREHALTLYDDLVKALRQTAPHRPLMDQATEDIRKDAQ